MPCEPVEFQEKFPERDATLWRYMDLPKFISLLTDEIMYFSSVENFDDPFEGSVPRENLQYRKYRKGSDLVKEPVGQYRNILNEELTKYTYINCWHISEHESAAMWDLYADRGSGIAVTTTIQQYTDLVSEYESTVYVGPVNYINYQENAIPRYNTLAPSFHKRKSFEHEKEFRGVVQKLPYFLKAAEFLRDGELLKSDIEKFEQNPPSGISIHADVEDLINHVYVAPDIPAWKKSVIESVTESFSELQKDDVTRSSLEEDPVY